MTQLITLLRSPLLPRPAASARPWAGSRLGAGIGESWLAGPDSVVDVDGRTATLDELAALHGERLVGRNGARLLAGRFPLLVKVIDAADWLSLQVHPDDALARELHGPDAVGKTEAWVVLDADPGSRLITGPRAGSDPDRLGEAIRAGSLGREDCEERAAVAGDSWLISAGTLHAIGAGTFIYEIEQPSDLTYRVSDWGRPAAPGRSLHPLESARAVDPGAHAAAAGSGFRLDGGDLRTPVFVLELVETARTRRPADESLEVVTPLRGGASLTGDGWAVRLGPLETAVVPAAVDAYRLEPDDGATVAIGRVP